MRDSLIAALDYTGWKGEGLAARRQAGLCGVQAAATAAMFTLRRPDAHADVNWRLPPFTFKTACHRSLSCAFENTGRTGTASLQGSSSRGFSFLEESAERNICFPISISRGCIAKAQAVNLTVNAEEDITLCFSLCTFYNFIHLAHSSCDGFWLHPASRWRRAKCHEQCASACKEGVRRYTSAQHHFYVHVYSCIHI